MLEELIRFFRNDSVKCTNRRAQMFTHARQKLYVTSESEVLIQMTTVKTHCVRVKSVSSVYI